MNWKTRGIALAACLVLVAALLPVQAIGQAKRFAGVTLTVATQNPPYIAKPVQMLGPEWEARTGGKINLITAPFGELYSKLMSSFSLGTATYDATLFASAWMGDFAGNKYLLDLTDRIKADKDLKWDEILPTYQQRVNWGGRLYALPIDGDVHTAYYRIDALGNPQYQARFKAKYGYDLRPPQSWKEYHDIAEFFNGWDWVGDGRKHYGVLEAYKRGGQAFWYFMSHAAAYVSVPGQKGNMFFDPETMKPQINNPGFVKALEDWVALVKLGPPGMINFDSGDVRSQFAAGTAALAVDWGDTGIIGDTDPKSVVKGKTGTLVLPGSLQLYNYKTGQWTTLSKPNAAPYLAFGGWVCGVTATTKHPDAAYDFCRIFSEPKGSYLLVTTGETGLNPFRYSHFTDLSGWRKFGFVQPDLGLYLGAIKASLAHPNAQLDLNLPGQARYLDALETQLARAAAGELTAKAALDNAASEWDKITDDLGRAKMLELYHAWLGLPTH
jgi:multiple sugar transport system substrate-binding protein